MDFESVAKKALAFREERDWRQFHNSKDLAISISLEASELLELFQWSGADLEVVDNLERVREELADVLIYCLYLADATGLDPIEIMEQKLAVNCAKYPVDASRGTAKKYTEL